MSRNRSPVRHVEGYGRRRPVYVYPPEDDIDYMNEILERMRRDALRRRILISIDEGKKYTSK